MARWSAPLVRGKPQRGEEKQPDPWVLRFSTLCLRMSECRNAGREERESGGERRRAENSAAARGKRWRDPRFVCARVWEREKSMVRNGVSGAEQRETRTHLAGGV